MKGSDEMFKKLKLRRERKRKLKLIQLAKKNGIYIPPTCENYKQVRFGVNNQSAIGLGGWFRSLDERAKIAETELKKRGLI